MYTWITEHFAVEYKLTQHDKSTILQLKKNYRNFPGSPVIKDPPCGGLPGGSVDKNPPANAWHMGLISDPGTFHMPSGN